MMKRILVLVLTLTIIAVGASAQRKTDKLDRGLVVVPTGSSTNYVSWRRLAEEYYDVTYNLYKDEVRIAENLTTTSFTDNEGSTASNYQVAAVVHGNEQDQCVAVTAWAQYKYNSSSSGYIDLSLAPVYDRTQNHNDVTSHYSPNDAEFADLDGDGQLEMIIKRLNTEDAKGVFLKNAAVNDADGNPIPIYRIYPYESQEFVVLDAYDIDWQTGATTLLWRIDCGPNMVSSNSTEINIIAYDWDQDGKAEVVLRGADNMIVYKRDGSSYNIGNMNANTRQTWYSNRESDGKDIASMAYTNAGAEYLLYLDGMTGSLLQKMDFPLKRLEDGESDLNAVWGDSYGHRSSKYFLGAPYLDGKKASLFLGRGIYTRHKMMALDLENGQWKQRWRWNCYDDSSPWYGNGYHNFIVADVDEDGRDEIVYGSMVIDDNGNGLSTTGLGHGDAQHVGDFDPYRPGLEFFGCNEDKPGMNYRNATTSDIYIRMTAAKDDGRALAGNFSSTIPGCIVTSASTDLFSSVKDMVVATAPTDTRAALYWSQLNFRIYWDGDLGDEVLNSPGTARDAAIIDHENGRLFTSTNCNMNNDSKNNPCFQGDLIGDWREEIAVRYGEGVRIFTTGMNTDYSLPTLWHDHQYRQAMVWQMMAYNQPPHLSYFLGELEGYTVAPPPLTTDDRTVIGNNATIDNSYNGKHLLHNEYDNTSLTISGGVPDILTINVPTWVQGHDNNNNITTTTYTCTLSGALSSSTRLVKQGNGILKMSSRVHTHTGKTDIWGGTVDFNGTMENSAVWMNRHTTLNTSNGHFDGGLTMEYGATLNIGGASAGTTSSVNISTLTMNYGSRVILDVNGSGDNEHDWLNTSTLTIDDSKVNDATWQNYGPAYIAPVFKLRMRTTLGNGSYPIGHVGTVIGDLSKVKIECDAIDESHLSLSLGNDGILYLQVTNVAIANEANIEITGMNNFADDYYLPVVSITTNNTDGETPILTALFTALDGTETSFSSAAEMTLYNQNYENETDASSWTTQYAALELKTDHSKYIFINQNGGNGARSAYTKFYDNNSFYTGNVYTVEFDAASHYSNDEKDDNQIILFGEGASLPLSNAIFGNTNYVFKITGGKKYGTTYTVEGSNQSYSFTDGAWYHYVVTVNKSTRTVSYRILNNNNVIGSGQYAVDGSVNMNIQGVFVALGRAWSNASIDNISIVQAGIELSSYTFTEPGTLQVISAVEGYASGITTFEVLCPYVKVNNTGNIAIDYIPECSQNGSGITTNIAPTPLNSNRHEVLYDLQGRKLHNGSVAKGIYIIGNKKVVK